LLEQVRSGVALARSVAPRPEERRFLLHPTPPSEAPAEVYFPVRPCQDACFIADVGIDLPPDSGDGVELEMHVIEATSRPRLLSRTITPGTPRRIEVGLGPWADQNVMLRLGTSMRETQDGDFPFVQDARIGHCSARVELAPALAQGHATVAAGKLVAEDGSIALGAQRGELEYSFQPIVDTCWSGEVAFDAAGATDPDGLAFDYQILLVADGLSHEIAAGVVDRARPRARLEQLSLHDWFGRPAVLYAALARRSGAGGRALLDHARIGRCVQP
jgi:hypothetical protein